MVVTAARDIAGATAAAQCVVRTHERLVEFLRAGQTLAEVDRFVAETLSDLDCRSAFLRYKIPGHPPFPSHSCLSVNECIVHGTHLMSDHPLEPGDLFSIDIGVNHEGWIGDAAWTYAIEAADDDDSATSDLRQPEVSRIDARIGRQPERHRLPTLGAVFVRLLRELCQRERTVTIDDGGLRPRTPQR